MTNAVYIDGAYDMVNVVEGSEEAATAVIPKLGSLGDIRRQTPRALSPKEMKALTAKA